MSTINHPTLFSEFKNKMACKLKRRITRPKNYPKKRCPHVRLGWILWPKSLKPQLSSVGNPILPYWAHTDWTMILMRGGFVKIWPLVCNSSENCKGNKREFDRNKSDRGTSRGTWNGTFIISGNIPILKMVTQLDNQCGLYLDDWPNKYVISTDVDSLFIMDVSTYTPQSGLPLMILCDHSTISDIVPTSSWTSFHSI